MPTSKKIWDLLDPKQIEQTFKQGGHFVVHSLLDQQQKELVGSLKALFGADNTQVEWGKLISHDWIQKNFVELSLFGFKETVVIYNFNEIPDSLMSDFLEKGDQRRLILLCKKEPKGLKKIIKKYDLDELKLSPTMFWEFDKLLNFFINKHELNFSREARNYFLNLVPADYVSFCQVLDQVKIHHRGSGPVEVVKLEEVLNQLRVDQFELAELLGKKQITSLWKQVRLRKPGFDQLHNLIIFLQSHLMKLADPSLIQKKAKLSKYDSQIVSGSKLWSKSELMAMMEQLCTLELLSKCKDESVWGHMANLELRPL